MLVGGREGERAGRWEKGHGCSGTKVTGLYTERSQGAGRASQPRPAAGRDLELPCECWGLSMGPQGEQPELSQLSHLAEPHCCIFKSKNPLSTLGMRVSRGLVVKLSEFVSKSLEGCWHGTDFYMTGLPYGCPHTPAFHQWHSRARLSIIPRCQRSGNRMSVE